MPRSRQQKHAIAQACRDYPDNGSEWRVQKLIQRDDSARKWLAKWHGYDRVEHHHIFGRRHKDLSNHRCNLIRLFDSVHDYCHDVCKKRVELCCLYVNWQMHETQIVLEPGLPVAELYWDIDSLNRLCGRASLEGRIEVDLLPVVAGTGLEAIGRELMTFVGRKVRRGR